jgi:phage-related protein
MRNLPASAAAETHKPNSANAPIWLYEVDALTTGETLYLCRYDASVTVEGTVYQPFPIDFDEVDATTADGTREVKMTVTNVTRELYSILLRHRGFRDREVRARFVWSNALADPVDVWSAKIRDVRVNAREVEFTLRPASMFSEQWPRRKFQSVCSWRYRDANCGFPEADDLPLGVEDLPSCDRTLDGPNGCRAHGQAYADAGVEDQSEWPQRFGGFISIPRRRV